SDPWELTHPGMVLGAYAEDEFGEAVAGLEEKKHPADWETMQEYPVTTVVASTVDGRIDLIENGRLVVEGKLAIDGSADSIGSHVFILRGAHEASKGLAWHAISHHEQPGMSVAAGEGAGETIVSRLRSDRAFRQAMKRSMHPGMVMIVTDTPLHPDRRSGDDFVIMASA
ncbi:MAG: L,D-transpeptidase, partial [Chromatiaceae bacterium]|nr:L,D-transpeptidase [Chromatiaceae bacterium]